MFKPNAQICRTGTVVRSSPGKPGQPKSGQYVTGISPAMKRLTDARRALEERRALRELGLL